MLRKLRLDQKGAYEQTVAARYLAEMVVGFVDSRDHMRRIGREQGGIEHWDDIVIEHHDHRYEHIQIKRQDAAFDDRPIIRGVNRNTGASQDRSTLDDAIASLADHFNPQNVCINSLYRRFTLEVPQPQIGIKRDISIGHFITLCNDCKVDGVNAGAFRCTHADG